MFKNGYYLSVYSQADEILFYHNLGLRHDHNISLWYYKDCKVELIHHWEIERLSGNKHHKEGFFNKEDFETFMNNLLSQYGLTLKNMVHIFGTPSISNVHFYKDDFGIYKSYHAVAHLFSALLMDSEIFYSENILALSLDGGPDVLVDRDVHKRDYYMGVYSNKGKLEAFRIASPGAYWGRLKDKLGIEEGTLMALATASESCSYETIIDDKDIIYMYDRKDRMRLYNQIDYLINRINKYTMEDAGIKYNYFDIRFTQEENKISMIMKIIQNISYKMIEYTIDEAVTKYNINVQETYIALSGGYALNCPTNTHIMYKYKFKGQLIPPCANDGGQAIGMGLYHFYKNLKYFQFKLKHSYYGDFDPNGLNELLINSEQKKYISDVSGGIEKFYDDITEGPIIWFDGRAEIGPRALGHRSILADPRKIESKDKLNEYKQRQWWRPVAPIILEEHLENWFDCAFVSPYMLNNFTLKECKYEIVPAITHLDQTSRVQTLNKESDNVLYKAIHSFYLKSGVPIVCNTSLNDKGEPIISTVKECINFALRKKIKIMYVNKNRVELMNHDAFDQITPEKRDNAFFIKKINTNPSELTIDEYYYYYTCLKDINIDLSNKKDIQSIKRMYKKSEIILNKMELDQK